MALRFIDGFDHYPAAEILNKWTEQSNGLSYITGRFGGSALTTANRSLGKTLDAQATYIFGAAMFFPSLAGHFLRFKSGASTIQTSVRWDNTTGKLEAYRAGTTLLGSTSGTLNVSTWYYVEIKFTFNDTTGVVTIRVDGVDRLALTSQDTNNAGGSTADRILLGDPGVSNIGVGFDDLYVCDGSGSAPYNDFLNDCRVETLLPNANGTTSQLVGQDGNSTDNYLNVDETNSDDDTSYNESSTVGDKDTYNYPSLAVTSGTVYAVALYPWARKTDAGTRSIVTVARLSATEEDSAAITLPTSYTYVTQNIRTTKPGGGSWSVSDVNSAEFGVKVNA